MKDSTHSTKSVTLPQFPTASTLLPLHAPALSRSPKSLSPVGKENQGDMGIEGEDRVDSAPLEDRPRVRMYVDLKLSQQGSKGLPCGTSPDSTRQDAVPNGSAASRTQEGVSNSSYVDGKRDAVSNGASINGKGGGVSNDTSINGNQYSVSNGSFALEANDNITQHSPQQASPGATPTASSTRVTLGAPSPSPSPRGATRVYLGAQDGDAEWHGGAPSNAVTVSVAPSEKNGLEPTQSDTLKAPGEGFGTSCGRLLDELLDHEVGGTGADWGEEPRSMGPAGESLHLSHIHCTFLDDLLDGINRGATASSPQGTAPRGTSPQDKQDSQGKTPRDNISQDTPLNTTSPQDKLTLKTQETISQEHKDIQALQNTPRKCSQDASSTKDKVPVTKETPNQNQEASNNSLSDKHNDHKATRTHHNEHKHNLPQSSPKPNTGLQLAHKPSINSQPNEQAHKPSINPQLDQHKQPYLQQSSPTHINNTSQQQAHHSQLQEPTGPPRDEQLQEPTPRDEQLQDTLSPQSDQAEELARGLNPVSSPLAHDPLMQGATSSLDHQVAQNHGSTKILAQEGSAKATPVLYGGSVIQQAQNNLSNTSKSVSAVEQTQKKDSPSRSKLTPVLSGDSVTYFAQPPEKPLSTSKRIRQVLSQEPKVKPPISIKPTQKQSFKAATPKQALKTRTPKQTHTADTSKQAQPRDLTTRPTQEVNSQNPCQLTQEVGLHTTKREDVQEEEQDGTWSQTTRGKGRREEVEDPTPYVGVVEEAPPEPPPPVFPPSPAQVEALESPQEGRERVDNGRTGRSVTQGDDMAEEGNEHTTYNHRGEGVGQEGNSNPATTRPSTLDLTGWESGSSPNNRPTATAPLETNCERNSNPGSSPSPLETPDRERDPNSVSSPSSLETPDQEREHNSFTTSPLPLETESEDEDDDEGLGLAAAVSKVIRRSMRKMKRLRLSGRGSKNNKPLPTPDRSQDTEEEDLSEETQGRRSGLPPAPPLGYSTVRSPAAASIIVSSLMAALSPPPRETLSPPQASGDGGGEEEREGKRRRGSRPSSESRPLSGPFPPSSRPVSSNTRPVPYPSSPPTSLEVEVGGYLPNSNMDDAPGGSSWGATFIPRPSFSPPSIGPNSLPNSTTSSSNAANGSSRTSNSLSGAGRSPSRGPNSLNNAGHSPSRNPNNGAHSLPTAPNSLSNAPESLNSMENSSTHGPNSLSNGSSGPHHTVNIPNNSTNTSSQNINPTHSPNSQTQASDSPNRSSSSPNSPNHALNSQNNSSDSSNHNRQTGPSISSENGGGRLEDGSEDTGRRRGRSGSRDGSRERERRQQRGRQRERSESLPPTTTTIENGNTTTSRESSATPTNRDNEDRSSTDREINNNSRRDSNNSNNNNRRRRGRSRSGSARNSPRPHVGLVGSGRSGVGGGTWTHPHSGLMASLAVTLTTFNISRFAVLGARFGWPFVVQWCVVSAVLGLPLMTFHVTLGQYLGAGVVDMWVLSPVFQGVGYSIMLAEILLGLYCCVPIAWLFIFFRDSFITHNNMFRWTDCRLINCSIYNNFSTIVIEGVPKYFNQQVLQRGEGAGTGSWLQELGTLKFDMAFNIALIWIITLLALSRGNQWYGKVSYVAILVPLLCYLVVCLYLAAGTKDDLYINNVTNFSEFFMNSRSWMAASREVFLVWGLHSAVLQQMAAHNKRGHALYRDTTVLWVVTSLALVLAAVTGSSCVAGLNQHNLVYKPSSFETSESAQFLSENEEGGMFELEETIVKHLRLGPLPPRSRAEYRHHDNFYTGIRIRPIPLPATFRKVMDENYESGYQSLRIATELFPALLAVNGAQKISPFWSSLFYLSLLLFGIAQQLAVWRTVIEAVISLWRERLQGWETFITFLCCLFGFSAALPMATGAGIHILYFLDYAVSCGWWLMIIQLVQIFALLFVRGKPYSGQDIVSELLGREGGCGWLWLGPLTSFSWNIMVPVGLLVLSISSFKSGHYREVFTWGGEGGYWSVWACQLAAALQLFPILLVPLVGLVQTCRYIASSDDDLFERIQRLYRPSLRSPYSHGRHAFLSTSESDLRDGAGGEEGEETGGDSNRPPLPYSDPPPKYTPPPSYSTATGARLAKLVNQGVRQSMRRLRASFRGATNTTTPANTTDNETGVQTGGGGNSNNNSQSRESGGGVVSGSRPYIPPPDYVTVTECNNSEPPQYATLDPLRRQRALAVLSGVKIGDQGDREREREGGATTSGIQRNDSTRGSSFSRSLASGVRRSARRLAATLGVGTGAEDGAALVVSEASTTGGPQSSDGPQPYVYTNIELVSHSYA